MTCGDAWFECPAHQGAASLVAGARPPSLMISAHHGVKAQRSHLATGGQPVASGSVAIRAVSKDPIIQAVA